MTLVFVLSVVGEELEKKMIKIDASEAAEIGRNTSFTLTPKKCCFGRITSILFYECDRQNVCDTSAETRSIKTITTAE